MDIIIKISLAAMLLLYIYRSVSFVLNRLETRPIAKENKTLVTFLCGVISTVICGWFLFCIIYMFLNF